MSNTKVWPDPDHLNNGVYILDPSTNKATAFSGTITSITNDGTFALETGGNLAAINTAVGAQADAAWSLSGSASEIALLKRLALIPVPLEQTLLASGARTTTQTQADQTNSFYKGIRVVLDMTVVSASPSVTVEIDGKDIASGKYYPILTGAAVQTISTNIYLIYPGLTTAANSVANNLLPATYRIVVTANNANAGTYSVGYTLLP